MKNRLLAGALAVCACATVEGPKYEIKLPEQHATVPNGLRVIVLPDTTTDMVEVDVRYDVGSIEDPQGNAGLAHFVEHLMFQLRPFEGAPPLFQTVQEKAAFMNAYTNWDSTHYMTTIKKDQLETILAIESKRLSPGWCEKLDQGQFEREREVVRNEMRQRLGSPDGQLEYKLLEAVFPEGHPYRREIGGDDKEISAIQKETACKFIADFYTPDRATLIVAGNVTEKEVGDLVAKWFAPIEKRVAKPRTAIPNTDWKKKKVELEFAVEEPKLFVAFPLPPQFGPEGTYAQFGVNSVMGRLGGFNSEYEFATELDGQLIGGPLAPVVAIQMTLENVGKVDEALSFVEKAVHSVGRGVEEGRDMDDTRKQMQGDLVMQFDDLRSRTQQYGEFAQFDRDGGYFGGELNKIKAVDASKMRQAMERYANLDRATILVVKPKASGEGKYKRAKVKFDQGKTNEEQAWSGDPAEAKKPLPAPQVASVLSKAKRYQLKNGAKVVLLPSPALMPIMGVEVIFDVGSAHEPPDRAGLASIAARSLQPDIGVDMVGIDEYDKIVRLQQAGVAFGGQAGSDHSTIFARGINVYTTEIFEGMDAALRGGGDVGQEGLEKRQKAFKRSMKTQAAKDEVTMGRVFRETIYGKDHPYTLTGTPTVKTIGNINRDAVVGFRRDHYTAKNATIIVTGNFDQAKVEMLIENTFGRWPAGKKDAPVAAPAMARAAAAHIGIEGEDNPSVIARIGFPAPLGVDGQLAARMVLAEMLNLRMGAVREELGASYGTYAGYGFRVGPGVYQMGGALDGERAGEALKAMRDGIDRLRKGEKFDDDFVKARRKILRELVENATEASAAESQLAEIAQFELPPDHFEKLIKRVAALSPAQVHALIDAELKPELEVIVLLGGSGKIKKAYEGAGIKDATFVKASAE